MDELERAGRALRDSVAGGAEPNERVHARARSIVRRRRMFAAGSIATAVLAASIGAAVAVNGGNGLGVHTIAPAVSSTTRPLTATTTHVVPRGTTSTTQPSAASGLVTIDHPLPALTALDSQHLWRVEPVHQESVEFSADGGRTWTTRLQIAGVGDGPPTVQGVDGFDPSSAIVLAYDGNNPDGTQLPDYLERTTDGIHWKRLALHGLPAQLVAISFLDVNQGWGLTKTGGVVTTSDGGDTWRATDRPPQTAVVVCLGAPGTGWVATGTTVYRSVDDGATWVAQLTIPAGGGSETALVCRGDRAAYASFSIGAGQHIGGFLRTDDGGGHWRPLTEDLALGGTTVTAPGFPENQYRGTPSQFTADGTLAFSTGCGVCGPAQNWVVAASPTDRFTVGKFDKPDDEFVAGTASDASHLFAEIMRIGTNGPTNPVTLYASSDGGHTWNLRWSDPG